MDRLKKVITVVVMTAIITLCSIQGSAQAAVFTCTMSLDDCLQNYHNTTPDDFNITAITDDKPTVRDVLNNSDDEGIRNGYNSLSSWDLGIDKRFWHKGGSTSLDLSHEHLTVRAYKEDITQKTCHVYSFMPTIGGRYKTTCVKK